MINLEKKLTYLPQVPEKACKNLPLSPSFIWCRRPWCVAPEGSPPPPATVLSGNHCACL